jgi:hypothetical protein
MNRQQFQAAVAANAHLNGPLERAAQAGQPPQFGLITEAAVVTLMFPIAKYVLTQIGLPWLYELKRYSELQRLKFHAWIDEKYREEGFDPDAAEAAGDALMQELEQTTDAAARGAWERLTDLFSAASDP